MRRKQRDKRLGAALGLALLAAAIGTELRKPAAERTWEGRIVDFVPYDLRPPTRGRVRERWLNPSDPRLFTPRVFGVGWVVNLGWFVRRVRERRGARAS